MSKEEVIPYKEKLDLFLQKVKDLQSIVVKPEIKPFAINPFAATLDTVMGAIAPERYSYFSIDYFYQGFKNSGDIINGNTDAIKFLIWVLACLLQERFFLSETDRAYTNLQAIMNGNFSFRIKLPSQKEIPIVVNLAPYERDFILYKLPFLLQQNNVNQISQKVDEPKSEFHKMVDTLSKKEKDISDKLNKHQEKADEMVKFIKTQETDLNFVGLSNAFQRMRKEKEKVKADIENNMYWSFGVLLLIPMLILIFVMFGYLPTLYTAIPVVSIEILLLYIFRIFYQQFLFIKSELLQLDLRVNLCAFIEGYMEFKGQHKDDTVHLFEQLIFSNIISDEKKVPSTVDGLDTLAKLISEIRGQ